MSIVLTYDVKTGDGVVQTKQKTFDQFDQAAEFARMLTHSEVSLVGKALIDLTQ